MSGDDARSAVLGRIREALATAREAGPPGGTTAAPPTREGSWSVPEKRRTDAFRVRLESVGGLVWAPDTDEDVAATLGHVLRSLNAQRIALSDAPGLDPLVRRAAHGLPEVRLLPAQAGRSELLEADVGVSRAQWGIAETGTVVLDASTERHRLVSLLPPVHIALLPAAAILGTLGEALRAIRDPSGGVRGRAVTFVTGPSRTADIELTLVVGVHGPAEQHVILTPETPS